MEFNRIDVCEAWYLFAALYHGGQFTDEYKILGRLEKIGFNPRPNLRESTLSDNALAIYKTCVFRHIEAKEGRSVGLGGLSSQHWC